MHSRLSRCQLFAAGTSSTRVSRFCPSQRLLSPALAAGRESDVTELLVDFLDHVAVRIDIGRRAVQVAVAPIDLGPARHHVEPLLQLGDRLLGAGQGAVIEVELVLGLGRLEERSLASMLASLASSVDFCAWRFRAARGPPG